MVKDTGLIKNVLSRVWNCIKNYLVKKDDKGREKIKKEKKKKLKFLYAKKKKIEQEENWKIIEESR